MPKYTSRDNIKSGVPLGGIGAGKMELMPNGTINFITFLNNWSAPVAGSRSGIPGFHFGAFAESGGKKVSRLLLSDKRYPFPQVDKIEYEGSFPFARLAYHDKGLPLKIRLTASSAFIPGNKKDSSLPGAYFKFTVKNTSKKSVTASLLSIGRNLTGNWCVGRFNAVMTDRDQVHISFKNGRKDALSNDFSMGEMSISVPRSAGEVSYLGEWNLQGECFKFNEKNLRLSAWEYFSRNGGLPNVNTREASKSESRELGGAVAVKFELGPGQTKEVTFIYSWFFPVHTVGHIYAKWFKNSIDVARYLYKERERLCGRTEKWYKGLISSGLEPWLADALVNNLYPLFSSTWHARDGRFATYEAPIICPLMGTLDVRFYGSMPLAYMFPDLEANIVEQFSRAQRSDGYIPHDLGRNRLDLPSDGTTYFKWKDLCSKFALICYRDYLITGDIKFLKRLYPKIKKAMEWEFARDKNKDFLPDNEGQDQTFDLWGFYGANAYTSGIFLAALLACIKMARLLGDGPCEKKYKEWFKNGKESFEKKLWNGRYFSNYVSKRRGREDSCTAAQVNGQWYAHLLGLGYIADRDKIRKAIRSILSLNARNSPHGLIGAVFPGGKVNGKNLHSRNVFPGMSYAFASLCIFEGFKKDGLTLAKGVWDNFAYNIKTPWNQPDLVKRKNGEGIFGDYYMRSMVIWSLLPALAKKDASARRALKAIK